jgi:hypothetical protein
VLGIFVSVAVAFGKNGVDVEQNRSIPPMSEDDPKYSPRVPAKDVEEDVIIM